MYKYSYREHPSGLTIHTDEVEFDNEGVPYIRLPEGDYFKNPGELVKADFTPDYTPKIE